MVKEFVAKVNGLTVEVPLPVMVDARNQEYVRLEVKAQLGDFVEIEVYKDGQQVFRGLYAEPTFEFYDLIDDLQRQDLEIVADKLQEEFGEWFD